MAGLVGFEHICQALALNDFDSTFARQRMSPVPRDWEKRDSKPMRAAVMILLFPADDERLRLVLTLRQESLRGHSGQVSFPGGRQDAQDESLTATAIRETCEEIGVCKGTIRIIGCLPRFYIPASHFDVHPIVAKCDTVPCFDPNPAEVADVFSFALEDLLNPRFKCDEQRIIRGYDVYVPFYDVHGHKVWGATAIMLSELEERLRLVVPEAVLLEFQ